MCLNLLLFVVFSQHSRAEADRSYTAEYIQALYVVRLHQFVYWQHKPKIYDLCITGPDDLGATLVQVAATLNLHKQLNIKQKNLVSDFSECEVLYISKYSEFELSQILYKVKELPILTVSNTDKFLERGGMVQLHTNKNTIGLEINNTKAQVNNIRLSSKLLEMAITIK